MAPVATDTVMLYICMHAYARAKGVCACTLVPIMCSHRLSKEIVCHFFGSVVTSRFVYAV